MSSTYTPASGHLTDEQLVRESVAGCSHSFAALVERYEGRLFRFVRRWASSEHDAEDITQDAFVEAWRCLHRYDDRWRFSTWLYTIASRRAASHLRKRRETTSAMVETREDTETVAPGSALESAEQRSEMWQLADALLSEEQRVALWLKYAEGMSAIEIGQIIGKKPVAVRVMLFRARERLAAELVPETSESERSEEGGHAVSPVQVIETGESNHSLTNGRLNSHTNGTLGSRLNGQAQRPVAGRTG